ncbi:MAG: hypothetical protein IJ379_04945 [Lachnospiraceae bacterium]|nr:hypothetical protein [Lachnospiraceae bacterium]
MSGVRECWLIDIDKEMVYVYDDLQESVITSIYNFEDTIPIAIYEGRFTICLEDMISYGQK